MQFSAQPKTQPLCVAVSGGPDSMALLHMLHAQGRAIKALTVDHGLRPEAAQEAQMVAEWCCAHGIEHHTLRITLAKQRGNLMARARKERYRALIDWCLVHRVFTLALAHHADDLLETVLVRQNRNSGAMGLAGIAAQAVFRGITFVRPLLGYAKADLIAYCRAERIPFVTDPSNADPKFDRTRARTDIAGWDKTRRATALARIKEQGQKRHEEESKRVSLWPEIVARGAPGALALDWRQARHSADPGWYLARTLAYTRPQHKPFAAVTVNALLERLASGQGATLGGCQLVFSRRMLWIVREQDTLPPASALPEDETTIWDERFILHRLGHHAPHLTLSALGTAPRTLIEKACPGLLQTQAPAIWREGLPALWQGEKLASIPTPHDFRSNSTDYSQGATFCPGLPLEQVFHPAEKTSPIMVV